MYVMLYAIIARLLNKHLRFSVPARILIEQDDFGRLEDAARPFGEEYTLIQNAVEQLSNIYGNRNYHAVTGNVRLMLSELGRLKHQMAKMTR